MPEVISRPEPIQVLNIGRGVAAAYTLRLFADLGAACSWWQWDSPQPGEWPANEGFRAFFEHDLDLVRLERARDAMLESLCAVVASFDLVISDFSATELPENELFRILEPHNPAIVVANADHFGRHGPYARWAGDEFTDYAMGGYWSLGGESQRAPLRVPGRQAQFHCGMHLTFAALAALRHARLQGTGQEVEVAAVEAMLGAHLSTGLAWTHEGRVLLRVGCDLFRAVDGWVYFNTLLMNPNVFLLIEQPELMDDPRWSTNDSYVAHRLELWGLVEDWCRGKTVAEIVPVGQELRVPVTAVETAETLLADEHMRQRGYFRQIGAGSYPGSPLGKVADSAEPAPNLESLLGAAQAGSAPVGSVQRRHIAPAAHAGEGPLAGLRILEMTHNWAGPIAARHFADLGAEVIKVELATKPAARSSHYPGVDPGKYHWNRSGYFNLMNRNKRDISLNVATPEGRDIFFELVKWSDALIENNSARVMANLGVDYDRLLPANPRLVMVSISGFGATGPHRDWLAYGSNIEAACGLAAMTGYDESTPFRTGSYVPDPIAGGHAAIAMLAALERRDRTGEGSHIDISLVESALPFMLESFAHLAETGSPMPRRGNADPEFAPTGAYRCAGRDDWLTIAVRTDAQWAALCDTAGLACDRTLSNEERLRCRDAIDAELSLWTATQSQFEAVRALQERGIPAAPILHNWQLHSDPHLFARQSFISIDHPDTGVMSFTGFPWSFSLTPPSVRMPSPRFAQDNAHVFQQMLGLSQERVRHLYEESVTSDAPIGLNIIFA